MKVDDHSFERKSSKCSSNGSFRRKKFGKITETFMNQPNRVPFELGARKEEEETGADLSRGLVVAQAIKEALIARCGATTRVH